MPSPAQLPVEPEPLASLDSDRPIPIDGGSLDETVQFLLPRRALAAIDPIAIVSEARRDGVNQRRIAVDDRGAGADEAHLTCGFTMAIRLVRAIERAKTLAADRCDGALAVDLATANHSALTALGSRMRS